MTDRPTHRDVPRHRGSLSSQPLHRDDPTRRSQPRNRRTEIRRDGYTADETARIDRSHARHLRGIPIVTTGTAPGAIPNTTPGREQCSECGRISGQWHHKACTWEGLLP